MGTGDGGERCRTERSIVWIDSDDLSPSRGSDARDESIDNSERGTDRIDMEFEWFQLCHGCGEQKWFSAMICENCRKRHGVSRR